MKGFGKQIKSTKKKISTQNTASSKEKLINQAIKFHLEGNIQSAAKSYQYFINQGFKDHRVFSNYGGILQGLKKLEEAKKLYSEAIKLNPNFADAYSNLGNVLRDLGNFKEAELSTRKAIALNPDLTNAHANLGLILLDLGKFKEAELSIRKAIELNPNFAEAHFNLGNILKELGKLQEAKVSLSKAIALKPDYSEAHSNLGNIFRKFGNFKEAELSIRKAIELKPNCAEAHANLGNTLELLGKREEAKSHWAKAVELKPKDEKLVISLAHHLSYERKYELALKYLSKNESNASQSLYLGCLLSLNREKEFDEKYKELYKKNICNADIGGIIEHANILYGNKYKSSFCNEAINYILLDKINEESFSENHLNELIAYNKKSKKENRSQGLLTNGIQTSGNLFTLDFPFIKSIKKALKEKIELYKNHFKDSGQGFINNWPKKYDLRAWMISMNTGGFLAPHNHEYGWITGSFYLQIPKYNDENNNAGNIAFSYQGPRYPNKDKSFDLTIKKIETRDICIFPSSLFHHTIPFESSEERICFVFDLVQK